MGLESSKPINCERHAGNDSEANDSCNQITDSEHCRDHRLNVWDGAFVSITPIVLPCVNLHYHVSGLELRVPLKKL